MAELQQVLGDRPPSYADLEQLPYLQACIKEVMRLYPAIPVFPREAAADDVLPSQHPVSKGELVVAYNVAQQIGDLGWKSQWFCCIHWALYSSKEEFMRLFPAIPVFLREAAADVVLPTQHPVSKGTLVPAGVVWPNVLVVMYVADGPVLWVKCGFHPKQVYIVESAGHCSVLHAACAACFPAGDVVFMSSYALGRSPAIWSDPLTFDPSRFSPTAEAAHHRFQFLPFGAGARMCLGASFAQMSVSLMVASLLQKFKFDPVTPCSPLIPVTYDITMNFNETRGLHMRVSARSEQQEQEQQELRHELAGAAVAAAR
jgi:cytochrome P450